QMEPHVMFGGLGLMTLDQLLALQFFLARVTAALIGAVAVATLLLAVTGLYSSVFYSVHQRRRELILRILLGANTRTIFQLALRSMAAVVIVGAGVGPVAAMGLLPLTASIFFGIQPIEPLITGEVALAAITLVLMTTFAVVWPLTRGGASVEALRN